MEFTGKLEKVTKDWDTGREVVVLSVEGPGIRSEALKLAKADKVSVRITPYRKSRSLDANALLWTCLGRMAQVLELDKWDVYLMMLKKYGQYTYMCIKKEALESMKRQWREIEVVGEGKIGGKPALQLLCYFGSSTYNTQEFSVLLNGVITEMKDMELEAPTSEAMQRSLELWEKQNEKRNSK